MSGRTVWKFTVPIHSLIALTGQPHGIPDGARFLHCHQQHGDIGLWYEIPDPDAPQVERLFYVFGTGAGPIPDGLVYVGTALSPGGDLVLHVYEAP